MVHHQECIALLFFYLPSHLEPWLLPISEVYKFAFKTFLHWGQSRRRVAELQGVHLFAMRNIDMMCDGLRMLGDIYNCIEEIMSVPQAIKLRSPYPQQKKMVEEELEQSLVQSWRWLSRSCNYPSGEETVCLFSSKLCPLCVWWRRHKLTSDKSLSRRPATTQLLKAADWSG